MKDHRTVFLITVAVVLSMGCLTAGIEPLPSHILTMAEPQGKGSVEPDPGTHAYDEETLITIVAEPATGWEFIRWEGDAPNDLGAEDELIVSGHQDLQAVFQPTQYSVRFIDHHGETLDTVLVNHGEAADPPADPTKHDHVFLGWDTDFSNVTEAQTVTATYGPVITHIAPVDDARVPQGTSETTVNQALSQTTTIKDGSNASHEVHLIWTFDGYDGSPGTYDAQGHFALPAGVYQTDPPTELIVAAQLIVQQAGQTFAGGSGSENDPYLVTSPLHLAMIADHLDSHFLQSDHIEFSNVWAQTEQQSWEPIGSLTSPFTGVYNGAGYTISGLTLDLPTKEYVGLFAVNHGTLKNIAVESFSVTGHNAVGSVVGENYGSIVSVTVHNSEVTGNDIVGGVLGSHREGFLENSQVTANVSGRNQVGGLAGSTSAVILNSSAQGIVQGHSTIGGLAGNAIEPGEIQDSESHGSVFGTDYATGGLVGLSLAHSIYGSHSTATVSGDRSTGGLVGHQRTTRYGEILNSWAEGTVSGQDNVGGLVGNHSGSSAGHIEGSYASGSVTGRNSVGGLIGRKSGQNMSLARSYATGDVHGEEYVGGLLGFTSAGNHIWETFALGDVYGRDHVGGLAGRHGGLSRKISDSYAHGAVSGEQFVGGLVGTLQSSGQIHNSYAVGEVESIVEDHRFQGGLVGLRELGAILHSFYDRETTTQHDNNGTGKDTDAMMTASTYSEWDFSNKWDLIEGESYPFFRWAE